MGGHSSNRQRTKQQSYQRFLDSLSNSQTQKKYDIELKCYVKYLGINDANALITPDLIDSSAAIRQAEDQIIEYLKHLANVEKLAHASINVRLAAILYFYKINRVNINRKYVSRFKPAKKKVRKCDLAYTHEQINTMIGKANTRDKMIVLLMASTGMRIGALCSLTIGTLNKMNVKGYPSHIYKIIVYEGEPEQYYTFTTFECANAIDDYLKEREHFGEELKMDAPLIRGEYNHSIVERAQKPEFLTTKGIQRLMDRLLIGSRLRVRTAKKDRYLHRVMKSHGLRKFTITQMKKAQMDFSDREYLVGHKVSRGLDINYDRTSEEDRLLEYLKALDFLTISPENRLRKQVAEQENTIKVQLVESNQRVEELKKQIEMIQQVMQKDQAQVRKIRASPGFKEKLQKG
jgi:integrase